VTSKAEPLLFRQRRSLATSRAARFVWVGAGGFAVQLLVLYALAAAGLPYLVATALAVEAAIVHNFLWHERWTWADRTGKDHRLARFVRFNGSTAVISIAGNMALMGLFAGSFGWALLPSNLLAVLTLSVLNYVSADRLVFATKLTLRPNDPTPM
jgi:putative flippase GtrA